MARLSNKNTALAPVRLPWRLGRRAVIPRLAACLGLLTLGGCFKLSPSLQSGDPSVKIPKVVSTAENGRGDMDREEYLRTVKLLVADLDSDDFAVRMYSIHALQQLTGQRYDYEPYLSEKERHPALSRWEEHVRLLEKGQEPPPPPTQAANQGGG